MSGGKQPANTTQTTIQKLPEWVERGSAENYEFAKAISDKPYTSYQGQTIADIPEISQRAAGILDQRITSGATDAMANAGLGALSAAANYAPQQVGSRDTTAGMTTARMTTAQQAEFDKVRAGLISEGDVSKYLNPFIGNVENHALSALDDSRVRSLMGNANSAKAAGAFGGSRSAIVDAVTNAEAGKNAGALSANLRAQGFDTAIRNMTSDIDRTLNADQFNSTGTYTARRDNADRTLRSDTANADRALTSDTNNVNRRLASDTANADRSLQAAGMNQSAGLNANGQRITAGGALSDFADATQARNIRDYAAMSEIGKGQRADRQAYLDDAQGKWQADNDYDLERLNLRLSSLGMSPYGKSETSNKTSSGGNSSPDYLSAGVGVLSLLPSLFAMSDRDEKTDIKKVGKDTETGIPLYSYRYKGDPKTYPKVVGPMAQDIEKKMPGAVKKIAGRRVVDKRVMGALS